MGDAHLDRCNERVRTTVAAHVGGRDIEGVVVCSFDKGLLKSFQSDHEQKLPHIAGASRWMRLLGWQAAPGSKAPTEE
jgi:hypothetical protein